MCKFVHLRTHAEFDTLNGTRLDVGGVTLAFEHNGNTVMYAAAKCHWRDNFCKHTGRAKSEGRLKSPHYRVVFNLAKENATSGEIQQAVIDHFQANEEF